MILRVPTGFEPLDRVCQGGFPLGSIIVLVGPPGTRKEDFLHTLSVRLASLNGSRLRENQILPERIWYLTLVTTKQSVLRDVGGKFSEEFYATFSSKALFRSFWELPESFVDLAKWLEQTDGKVIKETRGKIFSDLSRFLEREASHSILIFFPLNDFALFFTGEEKVEFLAFLEEMGEASKKWGFVVLALLVPGTLSPSLEANILSKADGIITFRKEQGRETMVCEKLLGTLLEEKSFMVRSERRGVELEPLNLS